MTTIQEAIRAAVPDATDDFCDFIAWERTPFPVGAVPAKGFYKAASGYHRAYANGLRLCTFCHRVVVKEDNYECDRCLKALNDDQ